MKAENGEMPLKPEGVLCGLFVYTLYVTIGNQS